jgi:hypothetical protein
MAGWSGEGRSERTTSLARTCTTWGEGTGHGFTRARSSAREMIFLIVSLTLS